MTECWFVTYKILMFSNRDASLRVWGSLEYRLTKANSQPAVQPSQLSELDLTEQTRELVHDPSTSRRTSIYRIQDSCVACLVPHWRRNSRGYSLSTQRKSELKGGRIQARLSKNIVLEPPEGEKIQKQKTRKYKLTSRQHHWASNRYYVDTTSWQEVRC